VATTYLPLLLADIREAPGLIGLVMTVNSAAGFAAPLLVTGGATGATPRDTAGARSSAGAACSPRAA
jgi:hypothetical protein